MDQLKIHKKIDDLMDAGAAQVVALDVRSVVTLNSDARRYFYSRVDETWFDWLWENGALDVIKEKPEDTTQYSYKTPELEYLVNVVEKIPAKVVEFMLSVPISDEGFNPEVIDRFLWISSKLPAGDLARMVSKIHDEQWVRLMARFNRWGFEYKTMFETLMGAGDWESGIVLADAVLLVKTAEDTNKKADITLMQDNPFYLTELHQTEVFACLTQVGDTHLENALKVATNALSNVVKTGGNTEDGVFPVGEVFFLFDVDFFSLRSGGDRHYSFRDDVRELAAVVKSLIERAISTDDNSSELQRIYSTYIAPLPDSRSMWRLRLYVWSLRPEVFKEELKKAFFRGLESEKVLYAVGGSEYEHALKKNFILLSDDDQREYVRKAFELFESEKERPHGYGIFSSILASLSDPEIERAVVLYKKPLKAEYQPEPGIRSYGGTIAPRAPAGSDHIWKGPIATIVETLKTLWTPEQLKKIDGDRDFLHPINAEGVADKIRAGVKERIKDYTQNALLFFDRNNLDAHYTYAFLRGVQEAIRLNREIATEVDWQQILVLGKLIASEGKKEPFDHTHREREAFNAWLVGWSGVHGALADVLQEFLRKTNGVSQEKFIRHRDDVLAIVEYVLAFPDPEPEDEKIETAGMTTTPAGETERRVSDPYSIAINSVRGRGFEALALLVLGLFVLHPTLDH